MERKTKVHAEDGKQEIFITREFDLPVDLLFKAYTEAELLEQWMGTSVKKLENRKHGSYEFVTTDPKGNKHGFSGTIHSFDPGKQIIRTFEMEQTGFDPQLEFLAFEPVTDETSKLQIHILYKSVQLRDQMLKMPFEFGINMAHDRLQQIASQLK